MTQACHTTNDTSPFGKGLSVRVQVIGVQDGEVESFIRCPTIGRNGGDVRNGKEAQSDDCQL